MVRGQGWKYIAHPDGEEFLYNLADDPTETVDLSDDPAHTADLVRMKDALERWKAETPCAGQ
jgi:arylsulfatase A-like enzyme